MERVANLLRDEIGRLVLSKLSDPRIDPARTSITRVEITEDLLTAKVYVSVIGTKAKQNNALRALRHAAGHMQKLVGRKIRLRHTPVLDFELDSRFKNTLQTLQIIQQAMNEIDEKEQVVGQAEPANEPAAEEAGPEG